MALPELIEIVPLDQPVRAEITVPGSKSITNRALILAALADGEVTLTGALWSEDTQIMVECLQKLGFDIRVDDDSQEFCNKTIKVKGLGGKIPNAGTIEKPLELFVGNAGTAARFLSAFVCLGDGVYRLSGVPRMHERPQAALFSALRDLGYRVESENGNDKLPVKIFGEGAKNGNCRVSVAESSQFASALLLCSKVGCWNVRIKNKNDEDFHYVAITQNMVSDFFTKEDVIQAGSKYLIAPDDSSSSYFRAAGWLLAPSSSESPFPIWIVEPRSSLQVDVMFTNYFHKAGEIALIGGRLSRKTHLGDSIMTAIVMAPLASHTSKFTDLGRLRVQECERVVALRTELTKCGATVVEEGDTLTVWPSTLHGAEIETYNDHRMAMCFAILGLKVPGIKIKNPACVKKTFPNFFQKLAAQPPHGLGATILDAKSGRKLTHEELFAD